MAVHNPLFDRHINLAFCAGLLALTLSGCANTSELEKNLSKENGPSSPQSLHDALASPQQGLAAGQNSRPLSIGPLAQNAVQGRQMLAANAPMITAAPGHNAQPLASDVPGYAQEELPAVANAYAPQDRPAATLMSVLSHNRDRSGGLLTPPAGRAQAPTAMPAAAAPANPSDGAMQGISAIDAVRASIPTPHINTTVLSTAARPDTRIDDALRRRRNQPQNLLPAEGISQTDLKDLF